MSLIGINSVYPYSLTGIQDITGTVNGNVIVATISVAGQTFYLSASLPDINGNVVLTLNIPNASTITTGLLTSTDWNTFNGKENILTFTSPLTRVGNTISFDYNVNNTWTGTQTYTNDIFYTSGSIFYTALPNATSSNVLYVDPITGQLTFGAVPPDLIPLNNVWTGVNTFTNTTNFNNNIQLNALPNVITPNILYIDGTGLVSFGAVPPDLIPLNNVWTGSTNRFQNAVIVENENNSTYSLLVYRSQLSFPDFTYINNAGKIGYYDGTDKWTIDRFGQFIGGSIIVNDFIQATNNITTTSGTLGGAVLNINPNTVGDIIRANKSNNSTDYLFFNNTTVGTTESTFGFFNGTSNSWAIESSTGPSSILRIGFIQAQGAISAAGGIGATQGFFGSNINLTGTSIGNELKFTQFQRSPPINSWIATTMSNGVVSAGIDGDKVVIGNIYPADPSYGATIGAHNNNLTAWKDLYVNLGGTTIMPTLIVTVSFTPPSDRRLKDDIRYLDSGKSIDFIKRLKPCIYKRIDRRNLPNFKEPDAKIQHGFIADEIEEIAQTEAQKNLVDTFEFNGYKDCRKLAILNLIPEIVQANKEMIDKIERLETENKTLLERLSAIEKKLLRNINILK